MNKLYIDTRDNNRIVVRLETNKAKFEEQSRANIDKAQASLPMIQKVLKDARLLPSELDEINIETGPGSFTGLRVGIAIANALSFAALVRINGKKLSLPEVPEY